MFDRGLCSGINVSSVNRGRTPCFRILPRDGAGFGLILLIFLVCEFRVLLGILQDREDIIFQWILVCDVGEGEVLAVVL